MKQLNFTDSEVEIITSHPGWTKQTLSKQLKKLIDEGLCRESDIHDEFIEVYSDLLTPYNAVSDTSFLSCFKPLTAFAEVEPEWLIPLRIPKGQISLLASDGGAGKTTSTCEIVAAISSGKRCFLDPPWVKRDPALTAFLSTEDSVSQKLKKKLREAGANMNNVICPDFSADANGDLRDFKFGTEKMAAFVEYYKPQLIVFDPLQGFTPTTVNMGARNQMRDCLAPFIGLGEKYGTSFLILCHSNKRKGAYGRDRIADSADLWDIARSVMMIGYTEQPGQRYLSHEKSNYGNQQETILFSIGENSNIIPEGTTWKRDREFQEAGSGQSSAPKRNDCKEWVIDTIAENGGSLKTRELDDLAKLDGYSAKILRSAKEELKAEGTIYYKGEGFKDKTWYVFLTHT